VSNQSTRPAVGGVPIVTGVPFEACACVNSSIDMSVDVTWADGKVQVGYFLHKGYNPIQVTKISFGAGSLTALYNK
jgi:ABC-type uncharacterized transport system permease subunit